MASPPKLGKLLRKMREESALSLLDIKKAGGPDPSYINRVEHGKVNPREETVARLARSIAAAKGLPLDELCKVMNQLFEAAEFAAPNQPSEAAIRREFRELLRARQLDEDQIKAAMAQVSVLSMLQVIEGDDPLEIRSVQEFPRSNKLHRETVVLPDKRNSFSAGPRAILHVNGDLAPAKREQLKILARLVEKIISD